MLAAAPRQLRLWLSEPVALDFTTIELIDSTGRRTPVAAHSDAASLAMTVRGGSASTSILLIDLPALPPSAYRLSWRTLSSGDLHVTSGSIVFGVQRAANLAPVAAAATLPPPAEVLLHWLNFGALATLIGALALALLALPVLKSQPQTVGRRSQVASQIDAATCDLRSATCNRIRGRLLSSRCGQPWHSSCLEIGLLLVQAASSADAQAAVADNIRRLLDGSRLWQRTGCSAKG